MGAPVIPVPDVARAAVAAILTQRAAYWNALRAFNAAADTHTADSTHADVIKTLSTTIETAEAGLRKQHFPRAARVTVDQWGVYSWTPTGRVRQVWSIDTPTNHSDRSL